MSWSQGQVSGLGTITRTLCTVPGGQCQVTIAVVSGTVYAAPGTGCTTANGYLIPAGGLSIPGYTGSQGGIISVVSPGTPNAVSFWISTAQGTPGP